jgi:hypothetical protein
MKRPMISFRHFGGSGPLSMYWYPGPYGDAVEAAQGKGVGWFAPNGELLGVEFDDVTVHDDRQALTFKNGVTVEIGVNKGKVSVKVRGRQRPPAAA